MTTKKKIIIFQILLAVFFVLYIFWIFDKNFALLGGVTVVQDYKDGDYRLVSDFNSYLTSKDGKEYPSGRQVQDYSVKFIAYKQKSFTKAKVEVEYNNIDQELIRFGLAGKAQIMEDKRFENFDLYEYFSHYIVQSYAGQDVYLWQAKQPYYETIDNFLDDFSLDDRIAAYYYTIPAENIFAANKELESKESVFNKTLRGDHEFNIYLMSYDSDISFTFIDRNFYEGEDSIIVKLYKGGKKINEYEINDDGNWSANHEQSELREFKLYDQVEAGIYSLRIRAGTDIFIKEVKVNPGYLAINKSITLANKEESYMGYTNTEKVIISTKHSSGLQKIRFGENSFEIDKVGQGFQIESEPYSQLIVPTADVKINSWGHFADSLDELYLFTPENIVNFTSEENLVGADYFITTYFPIKNNKKVFYFENLDSNSNRTTFELELPWYKLGDEGIVVDKIRITFNR